jgi:Fe-S cluster assembly scaffold protein SufB
VSGPSLEGILPFVEPPTSAVPSREWPRDLQHAIEERGDEEGLIIQRDSTVLSRSIAKEQVKKGVFFTDLDTAVRTRPELVQRYFGKLVKTHDKFSALHTAFWSGGTFLYVPAQAEVLLPFHTCYWMSTPGAAIFPHTVIVVERDAKVSLIDEYLSPDWRQPALSIGAIEILLDERAELNYFHLQNWGKNVHHINRQESKAAPSAKQLFFSLNITGRVTLETVEEGIRSESSAVGDTVDERRCEEWVKKGLTREEAQYRVAADFFENVLQKLPTVAMQEKMRHYLVGTVTGQRPIVTLQRTAELHPEIRL